MSYAGATKKIELEKKGASLNVPFCRPTSEKDWETNTSNSISRVNHRSSVQEKAQQVSRPRPNPYQLECCEFKKKKDVLLVKKNDFLAFIYSD